MTLRYLRSDFQFSRINTCISNHRPLILDRIVCKWLYTIWPSFSSILVLWYKIILIALTLQPVQSLGIFFCIVFLIDIGAPRCHINESTRLSFFDFSPTLYLDMSYLFSHPTCLFGPTHFAFPPYTFIWPRFLWNLHRKSTLLVYLALLV